MSNADFVRYNMSCIRKDKEGVRLSNTRILPVLPLLVLLCLWLPATVMADHEVPPPVPLQPIIDRMAEGEALRLTDQTYQGPVTIQKAVSIEGTGGAKLLNDTSKSAVTVEADGARLQGFQITHNGNGDAAAVEIRADRVNVSQLAIRTNGYGILLRDANHAVLNDNDISWFEADSGHPENKGNGIDLYSSNHNLILDNRIAYMKDAIYLEKGRNETVKGNRVSHSRYGIHLMYIDDSQVTDNTGDYNFTGAMVMVVSNATVSDNSFRRQSGNVNSQGILLYDVRKSRIERNALEGNRVGVYMENAAENRISDNDFIRNFIGIQMIRSKANMIRHNVFAANVIEASEQVSGSNRLTGNYWDSFQGLDLTNDGISEMPYSIRPFYQNVIARNSAYQLFFQSPGMNFLSDMFAGGDQAAKDVAPLMNMESRTEAGNGRRTEDSSAAAAAGWALLVAATSIMILGGIRK